MTPERVKKQNLLQNNIFLQSIRNLFPYNSLNKTHFSTREKSVL